MEWFQFLTQPLVSLVWSWLLARTTRAVLERHTPERPERPGDVLGLRLGSVPESHGVSVDPAFGCVSAHKRRRIGDYAADRLEVAFLQKQAAW